MEEGRGGPVIQMSRIFLTTYCIGTGQLSLNNQNVISTISSPARTHVEFISDRYTKIGRKFHREKFEEDEQRLDNLDNN